MWKGLEKIIFSNQLLCTFFVVRRSLGVGRCRSLTCVCTFFFIFSLGVGPHSANRSSEAKCILSVKEKVFSQKANTNCRPAGKQKNVLSGEIRKKERLNLARRREMFEKQVSSEMSVRL